MWLIKSPLWSFANQARRNEEGVMMTGELLVARSDHVMLLYVICNQQHRVVDHPLLLFDFLEP
jgi:hypothetical protein